jgi:hypothetical protein
MKITMQMKNRYRRWRFQIQSAEDQTVERQSWLRWKESGRQSERGERKSEVRE